MKIIIIAFLLSSFILISCGRTEINPASNTGTEQTPYSSGSTSSTGAPSEIFATGNVDISGSISTGTSDPKADETLKEIDTIINDLSK